MTGFIDVKRRSVIRVEAIVTDANGSVTNLTGNQAINAHFENHHIVPKNVANSFDQVKEFLTDIGFDYQSYEHNGVALHSCTKE